MKKHRDSMITEESAAGPSAGITAVGDQVDVPVLDEGDRERNGDASSGPVEEMSTHQAAPRDTADPATRSSSVLLAALARQALVVVPLVLLLGIAGFVLNPGIYGRVFTIAAEAPTLAGATTVSAFQLGISIVPALAGVALNAGAGITSVTWIGAGLAAVTVPVILLDRVLSRQRS